MEAEVANERETMEQRLVIYRKDIPGPKYDPSVYSRTPSKHQSEEANERLEYVARVRRPELEKFLGSDFYNLKALSARTIDNKPERLIKHRNEGWVIPEGSLGRTKAITHSTGQSVLLWIKKNMGHVVNPDHVSIVVQPMD